MKYIKEIKKLLKIGSDTEKRAIETIMAQRINGNDKDIMINKKTTETFLLIYKSYFKINEN
jgi:hypothetical protein